MWAIGDVGSGVVAEGGEAGGRRVREGGLASAMAQKGQVGSYEMVVGEGGIWFGEGVVVELRRILFGGGEDESYVRTWECWVVS